MRFIAKTKRQSTRAGFTLMEVLAALLFMAIVIPVAVQGLRVASLAGEVGHRKKVAARIGQSVLDEMRSNTQTQNATSAGQVQEGAMNYQWKMRTETWPEDAMRLATVDVIFLVQGKNYDVQLSTLLPQ
jgi:prepilin-type N-terminal cleavage/methylation domain-containing protein